jgi:hypothetical protein
MKRFLLCLSVIGFLVIFPLLHTTSHAAGIEVDNTLYAELLSRYVKNGVVNYRGLKNEEGKLGDYLRVLEKTDSKALSRNERFAFYINAYNAWTLKFILTGYPGVKSIKDFGTIFRSPWEKKIVRIDGKIFSLNHIEHSILRPQMKDPRIHAVVNCASKSCPPLREEPFRGVDLDRQLDEQFRVFINDPSRNRLEGNTLFVSRIFDWYTEDFGGDVLGYFLKYAKGEFKKRLEANQSNIKIRYLEYDWSLNGN